MKKDDLKASLGKIRPREELIESTLNKIEAAQERKETKARFGFAGPATLRLAGALCSFIFVFFFGFAVARHGMTAPSTDENPGRSIVELDTVCVPDPDISLASFMFEDENTEWIIVECDVTSLGIVDKTDNDIAGGVAHRCRVELTAQSVQGVSENFSLKSIYSDIDAEICFYDEDELYRFVTCMSENMLIRLIRNGDNSWSASDFTVAE